MNRWINTQPAARHAGIGQQNTSITGNQCFAKGKTNFGLFKVFIGFKIGVIILVKISCKRGFPAIYFTPFTLLGKVQ